MADAKTKPTAMAVENYIAAIADDARRADCEALVKLMVKATRQPAVMWGTAIVGCGLHRYPLAGGKVGEICAVGFSSRKGDISIYGVVGDQADPAMLAKLGKHKRGKGCLYVARLSDIHLPVLEQLMSQAAALKSS